MLTTQLPYENGAGLVLPASFSPELRSLLTAMLAVDPARRVPLAQIRQLRWYKKHCKAGSALRLRLQGVLRLMARIPQALASPTRTPPAPPPASS